MLYAYNFIFLCSCCCLSVEENWKLPTILLWWEDSLGYVCIHLVDEKSRFVSAEGWSYKFRD